MKTEKTNMSVLKKHTWNSHVEKQKIICKKYKSNWNPTNLKLMLGCSSDLSSDPLNGLRHQKKGNTTGWYIWSGEWSDNEDFFKPICVEHLIEKKPELIKFLGLDIGFRFLIGKNNFVDVWYDEEIKNV